MAPEHTAAYFDAVLAGLDRLLPGNGTVAARYQAFRSQFVIPPAKCVVTGLMVALVCTATALSRADENQELQRLVQQGFIRSALAILLVSAVFDLAV